MMAPNRGIYIMTLHRRKFDTGRFRLGLPRLFACMALSVTAGLVATSARAETVRVGIVGASSDAPFFIADAKGYFSAEGLALELTSFDSGAKMVAPLGTGDLDAGGGAVSVGLYNAVKRGVGLKIVADKVHYGPGYGFASLLVRKSLVDTGKFKHYGDLKGLRLNVTKTRNWWEELEVGDLRCDRSLSGVLHLRRVTDRLARRHHAGTDTYFAPGGAPPQRVRRNLYRGQDWMIGSTEGTLAGLIAEVDAAPGWRLRSVMRPMSSICALRRSSIAVMMAL